MPDQVAISAHGPRAGTIEAYASALAQCHRAGVKTMIWTVDEDQEMKRWLADRRVAVLITNRPAEAVAMRASVRPGASPGA